MGFALLSGLPDVSIPLLLAAEVAYLGLLGTNDRFQASVDAQVAKVARQHGAVDTIGTLRRIMDTLPPESVRRFESLRNRCVELRQIALAIKDPGRAIGPVPLEEMQLAGLDRLLWIFVRLLYTQYSLERFLNTEKFLDKAGPSRLTAEIDDFQGRLARADQIPDETQRQRIRKTLEDSLQTSRDRLANFQKARDNLELVRLEIERLENKIRSLSELAINRQEPDFVTAQVDQVASSMLQAEKTMNDLRFATGLERVDDDVPPMLHRDVIGTKS
jgi:chemotaxis protein histidine kinase CheA